MNNILFINACIRGEKVSGTYCVADAFIKAYQEANPQEPWERCDLMAHPPACLTAETLALRDDLLAKNQLDDAFLAPARRFAAAGKILIAAPYWDLSFPALLKAYIEQVSVCGITFGYGENGEELGLCKAEKLLYITTSGGAFREDEMEMRGTGRAYLRGLCKMFGIPQFDCLWAQGLDLVGNDRNALLEEAAARARAFAGCW